jgi:hypothetical protein
MGTLLPCASSGGKGTRQQRPRLPITTLLRGAVLAPGIGVAGGLLPAHAASNLTGKSVGDVVAYCLFPRAIPEHGRGEGEKAIGNNVPDSVPDSAGSSGGGAHA